MAKYIKNLEKPVQKYRFIFQTVFALLCIWIGVEFYFFTTYLESGGTTNFYNRPAGVEGFLPISALMSIYYFFLTGEIHDAHPAGFFILLAIISISLVFGKSFCSWLCPVGFISELIGDFGEKIQKKIKTPQVFRLSFKEFKVLIAGVFCLCYIFFNDCAFIKVFFRQSV